jgi:FAD dependent oxidoreductase TIGR03364
MGKRSAIVIGAGIVGLAMARALSKKGYSVTVIERSERAVGASIRNFGMIWPIGQPDGILYERALRSRGIWKQECEAAGIWFKEAGSIHLAYTEEEWEVLNELHEGFCKERPVRLLKPGDIFQLSDAVVEKNLIGGLFSSDELIVDPREAIPGIAEHLSETMDVDFIWGRCVTYIADQTVYIGLNEQIEADLILVCNGSDLETLYPEIFDKEPFTKCKLQMMRFASQSQQWKFGPALCGGLSLVHYNSFKIAASLEKLKDRFNEEMKQYLCWGIHVMIAQNGRGELIVGDSHEYGKTHDPFNKVLLNEMILSYLKTFATFNNCQQLDSWNGTYAKLIDGRTEFIYSPENGVYLINALGGAGMTLSFGLAEEVIESLL